MASSIVFLVTGASLLGVLARVAIPPAAWIALVCLLHGTRLMPASLGAVVLWLTLYVALGIGNRGIIPAGGPVYFGILALIAALTAVPFVVDRLIAPRLEGITATLVFPLAWVTVEFLRSRFTPGASWGSIAYTQYGFLSLMQVAAFVGIWGISFLLAWCASVFDAAWSHGFDWNAVRTPVLACGAVLGAILLGGAARLSLAPTDGASIRTATLNRPLDLFVPGEMTRIAEGRVSATERPQIDGKLSRLHDWFLDGSRREARAGARLVVWPEMNLLVFAEDESTFLARAQRLAVEENVYLAMGMATVHSGERLPLENKLVLIDPAGRVIGSYLKNHPVQGWEESIMRVGDGRMSVVATPVGKLAGAICFDGDFPQFIRQAGQGAADLFIIPANEWKTIKTLHSQMAIFRAIENGVPMIRPAASGLSTAVDAWGRVLAVSDYFAQGDRTMTAQVPIGHVSTLYAKTGDLFAWLCVGTLVLTIGAATLRGRAEMKAASNPAAVQAGLSR
ncbi:MAG TPA: nitrilase-related carbon-nitrogen hydrolase [Vicinamibacterales bacterium]|jgi:apolipoprotein N-acyltransferase|nr:nitrilase-related carbon-nitrogen hydrolase [Vicinamibacterales bacterium]